MEITNNCSGCMACYSSCPMHAIKTTQNSEGFYTVEIDTQKCTKCGICRKICPQNNNKNIKNPQVENCYAIQAVEEECKKSSSGAVFPLMAKYIIEQGGYVCGATFSDDFMSVKHIIIDNINDLDKLRSSKYVQSYIGDTLKETKRLLDENKPVLFTGTPCQIAGLKAFLKKDYDNLYTIDVICHGTPSPLVWQKYLSENFNKSNIKKVNFRDKSFGNIIGINVAYKDSSSEYKIVSENEYLLGFMYNLILNNSCHFCNYSNLTRVGDITLGDFWGIEKIDLNIHNIQNGVSLVLANNTKGEFLINLISSNIPTLKKYPISENIINFNSPLIQSVLKHHNRKQFFDNLHSMPVTQNLKNSLSKKYDGIIANFWWTDNNYGAILSAYAIQQYLAEQGFHYNILNYIPANKYPKFSYDFIQNHLKLTHSIFKIEQLPELNNCTDNFVVGTDQVFRQKFIQTTLFPIYTLAFANFSKQKIAFSASFGKDKFDETNLWGKYIFKKLLKRFDAISVREHSGIKLCKKNFGIKVEDIIDPVLLLDKVHWDSLANDVNADTNESLVSYILDEDEKTTEIYDYIERIFGVKTKKIANSGISPESFLSSIKNAKYFITDSFHGLCFALIFNKKVICLTNEKRGNSRFENLKQKFNLDNLFYNNIKEIKGSNNLFKNIDYNLFLERLNFEREKAKTWIKNNMYSSPKNEKIMDKLNESYLRMLLSININDFKYERKFKNTIKKQKNKSIVFWGASLFLTNFLNKYKIKSNNILGIIDKNSLLWDKKINNYTIFPPEKLDEIKPEVIICSIKNSNKQIYPAIKLFVNEKYPNIEILPNLFD